MTAPTAAELARLRRAYGHRWHITSPRVIHAMPMRPGYEALYKEAQRWRQ